MITARSLRINYYQLTLVVKYIKFRSAGRDEYLR